MKKLIGILILIGVAALLLEILEILGGILLIVIGITALLIAIILWIISLIR